MNVAAASLISALAISGSCKSDGTPNDSGLVWAYLPGTSTTAQLYSDPAATIQVTQPITLDEGGRISRSDYPDGVFCKQPIRLYIEDAAGAVVSDSLYTPATAGNVSVDSDAFTGTVVDEVFDAALTSFGGQDFKYKESGGATARTVKAKFAELSVSVKDFGAAGDGIAIDTTGVQAAMNRVKALGGGTVYFPPGTYLIDQALTLSDADGVSLVGDGAAAAGIQSSHATADAFTFSNCDNLRIEGINVSNSGTSTGAAFRLTDCGAPVFVRVGTLNAAGDSVYRYGIYGDGCSGLTIERSSIIATQADASGRSLYLLDCPLTKALFSSFSTISGYSAEFDGTTTMWAIHCQLSVTVRYAAGLTGTGFKFLGGSMQTQSIATATDPEIRMFATNIDGYTVNVTTGATVTPDRARGEHIRIRGTTTGSAYVVAAPTPTPLTTARDVFLKLTFYNNAGGAITGWTMNAIYHLSAGPSTTDGQLTTYILGWDPDAGVWREFSRSVTT